MYALVTQNNEITQIGELQTLFPNEFQPTHLYAIQHGAKPVVEGTQEDQRFYWVTFDKYVVNSESVVRTYTNTPKTLEDSEGVVGLKSQWIAQFKQTANSLLAQTDWCVLRKAERDIAIPVSIAAKRAAILAECDRLVTAITAVLNMADFIQAVQSANWGNNVI